MAPIADEVNWRMVEDDPTSTAIVALLAGCGALQELDERHGEIESMRTVRRVRRQRLQPVLHPSGPTVAEKHIANVALN